MGVVRPSSPWQLALLLLVATLVSIALIHLVTLETKRRYGNKTYSPNSEAPASSSGGTGNSGALSSAITGSTSSQGGATHKIRHPHNQPAPALPIPAIPTSTAGKNTPGPTSSGEQQVGGDQRRNLFGPAGPLPPEDDITCFDKNDVLLVVGLTCVLNFGFFLVVWGCARWWGAAKRKRRRKRRRKYSRATAADKIECRKFTSNKSRRFATCWGKSPEEEEDIIMQSSSETSSTTDTTSDEEDSNINYDNQLNNNSFSIRSFSMENLKFY